LTYEEKVHNFGLRWLMDSASVARLRELDTTQLITLETTADGSGCSCDYDYWVEYHLVVPTRSGQSFRVEITEMGFADILKAVTEAEPVELSGIADMVMAGQADQIDKLKAELKETKLAHTAIAAELRTLKNGLGQQQNLWTYLRNLYNDLAQYTDGSTGLSNAELDELIAWLYRELDLWFNKDQKSRSFDILVKRDAVTGKVG
jgi:hypothetical protein